MYTQLFLGSILSIGGSLKAVRPADAVDMPRHEGRMHTCWTRVQSIFERVTSE